MRIGVLTAGGDAPGLNAAIRAIGQMAFRNGHQLIGIANGWQGLATQFVERELTSTELNGIVGVGGTILGTARFDLDNPPGGRERVLATIADNLDALVAIGGDGTQRISHWLAERSLSYSVAQYKKNGQPDMRYNSNKGLNNSFYSTPSYSNTGYQNS